MSNILNLSSAKLQRIATLKGQLEKLQTQLQALVGEATPAAIAKPAAKPAGTKRTMSAAGRAKIAAAARARWAKVRAAKSPAPKAAAPVAKKKFTMSAAARAKIAAAARARWAKVKAAKAK